MCTQAAAECWLGLCLPHAALYGLTRVRVRVCVCVCVMQFSQQAAGVVAPPPGLAALAGGAGCGGRGGGKAWQRLQVGLGGWGQV